MDKQQHLCATCKETIGSSVVQMSHVLWLDRSGDGYGYQERLVADAGVFCSVECLAQYCQGDDEATHAGEGE
jgi:hypothetical protein